MTLLQSMAPDVEMRQLGTNGRAYGCEGTCRLVPPNTDERFTIVRPSAMASSSAGACGAIHVRTLATLLLSIGVLAPATARADGASVAIFPSASSDSRAAEVATALDSALLASVRELQQFQVAARPAIDLPATALALGCAPESGECLSTIVQEAGVQALIASCVENEADVTFVTLTYFDARGGEPMRKVVRRLEDADVERSIVDAVPGMLRELLRLPSPSAPPEPALEGAVAPAKARAGPARGGQTIGPIVLAAAGIAFIGAGAGFGLAANANENEYRRADTDTRAEVDRAVGKLDTARTQALLANVGFGIGAATIAASAVWMAIDLSSSRDRGEASVSASLGPGAFVLRGHFGGRTW